MTETLQEFVIAMEPWLPLITTLLWGVYIFYTIRTFREIRRQTDMQIQAFLVVASKAVGKHDDLHHLNPESGRLVKKWQDILRRHIPRAVRPPSIVLLELTKGL